MVAVVPVSIETAGGAIRARGTLYAVFVRCNLKSLK
jgi:hypothetical protein